MQLVPVNEATFKAKYPSVTERVFGPYGGQLVPTIAITPLPSLTVQNDAGETISILRPDSPDPITQQIPLVPVDVVRYAQGIVLT